MRVGVRDHDVLNGLGVTGSRLMATYGLDGKPFRVEVRWPDFVPKTSAELRGRDRVLKDFAEFVGRLIDRGQSMSADPDVSEVRQAAFLADSVVLITEDSERCSGVARQDNGAEQQGVLPNTLWLREASNWTDGGTSISGLLRKVTELPPAPQRFLFPGIRVGSGALDVADEEAVG